MSPWNWYSYMLSFRNPNAGDLFVYRRVSDICVQIGGCIRELCLNFCISHPSPRIKITLLSLDQLYFPLDCTCTIKWYTDMLI